MQHNIDSPDALAALALVPEQLAAYVRAVAGLRPYFVCGFAVYAQGDSAVLAGYPAAGTPWLQLFAGAEDYPAPVQGLDEAIDEVCGKKGLKRITVLAPRRPSAAPVGKVGYTEKRDCYLALKLPSVAGGPDFSGVQNGKLRNMLRRAAREVKVRHEAWGEDCAALVKHYISNRALAGGTRHIFSQLQSYAGAPGISLFAARDGAGVLQGFCIADFTPLDTAFYMFAFRRREAPPGTADLLLAALVEEAQAKGYAQVNLGLEINGGIAFFKRKWGARPFLPLVECSWALAPKPGFLGALFKKR